jgi:hypothetical protein
MSAPRLLVHEARGANARQQDPEFVAVVDSLVRLRVHTTVLEVGASWG